MPFTFQEYLKQLDRIIRKFVAEPPFFVATLTSIRDQLRETERVGENRDALIMSSALGMAFCQRIVRAPFPSGAAVNMVNIANYLGNLINARDDEKSDIPQIPDDVLVGVSEGAVRECTALVGAIMHTWDEQGNILLRGMSAMQCKTLLLTLGLTSAQLLELEEDVPSCGLLRYFRRDSFLIPYYNGLIDAERVSVDEVGRYLWNLVLAFPHRVNLIWTAQVERWARQNEVSRLDNAYLSFIGSLQSVDQNMREQLYGSLARGLIDNCRIGCDLLEVANLVQKLFLKILERVGGSRDGVSLIELFMPFRNGLMRLLASSWSGAIMSPTYQLASLRLSSRESRDYRRDMLQVMVNAISGFRVDGRAIDNLPGLYQRIELGVWQLLPPSFAPATVCWANLFGCRPSRVAPAVGDESPMPELRDRLFGPR